MDDVDAVQAQIASNMLTSHDWVTAHLDGVAYMEKAPLIYWMMAVYYKIFGVHELVRRGYHCRIVVDWPSVADGGVLQMWAFRTARRDFMRGCTSRRASGSLLCTAPFKFPDVMVAAAMAFSMWAFLRAIDDDEARPSTWAFVMPGDARHQPVAERV